jgi:arginase
MTAHYVPWFLDQAAIEPELLAPGTNCIEAQPGPGDQLESLAPIHRAIADQVAQTAASGGVPKLSLGDCCQVIPVMAGLARAKIHPTLIWLDSHGDFNTWATTPSKFLGGMPLAMLTGRGDQRMLQAVGLKPIADESVILSDARDLDPGERDLVQTSHIRHVGDVRDLLAAEVPDGPIYVHFDTDLLDAREAPAFLYPVPGGPSPQDVAALLARIRATGRMVAATTTAAWDSKRAGAAATLAAARTAWAGIG